MKLKSEAEEWVKTQIKDKPKTKPKQLVEQTHTDCHKNNHHTKNEAKKVQENTTLQQEQKTPCAPPASQEFKTPPEQTNTTYCSEENPANVAQNSTSSVEGAASSLKEVELDQASNISNSASSIANDSCASSVLHSSQESASINMGHGEISDPREDFEEEREERTNIKTTSEREAFEQSNEHLPGILFLLVGNRLMHNFLRCLHV